MSYILDALKKVERERRLAKVPTLDTAHRTFSGPRRRAWPWIAAGALLVNAALVVWLLAPASTSFVKRSPVSPATPAVPAVVSGQPAPASQSERAALVSGQRVTAPPADRAPRSSRPEKPAAVAVPPPEPAPSPRDASASRRPQPVRPPTTSTGRADATPGPPEADAPATPKAAPEKPRPAHALPTPKADPREVKPDTAASGAQPQEPKKATGSSAPPTAPAAVEKPPVSIPAPPAPPAAAAPDKPAVTPTAPGTTRPAERGTGSLAALQDMPPPVQEVIQAMKIQALVYSDDPAERLVFINNRKYREGQPIGGTVVVERITPEGVILNHEGKRFLRRQY